MGQTPPKGLVMVKRRTIARIFIIRRGMTLRDMGTKLKQLRESIYKKIQIQII
jgi:hypothetical protein